MPELTLFISHRSTDRALAKAIVELFEKALKLPARQVRCTSVDGYRLPVGADTDEQLRREVFDSRAFVGIITPSSATSHYVLFELGARWGAKKHLAPVLARGADSDALGGPLSGINALRADVRSQVIQLVEDVAEYLQMDLEPAASFQEDIDSVVREASTLEPDKTSEKPLNTPLLTGLTDEEMVGVIRSWLNESGAARSLKPIVYERVDEALRLPRGTAARLIADAASPWYDVEQQGPTLVVFKEKRREPIRRRSRFDGL